MRAAPQRPIRRYLVTILVLALVDLCEEALKDTLGHTLCLADHGLDALQKRGETAAGERHTLSVHLFFSSGGFALFGEAGRHHRHRLHRHRHAFLLS